uniref:DNA-directed RNA polymerase III subunit RPC7 n=1 Tax=Podarcis muralis TaxID=64176 RepID=A0A670JRJ8_PODMU
MAGRGGRGRGRGGHMTFNVEAVGIGKGEALPPPTLQPSPLFPVKYKPVPLQTGEEVEYMLALKQELRGAMKNLPYFIKPSAPKKGKKNNNTTTHQARRMQNSSSARGQ